MTNIPHELLLSEILHRLPAKSVLHFKSVSKQWYSLLTSHSFESTHIDHIITNDGHQNPNKILQLMSAFEFCTIDCYSPEDGVHVTRNCPLPFTSRPDKVKILASVHGLVCVGLLENFSHYYFSDLILWNPFTGECNTLSKTNYNMACYVKNRPRFGLYYSSPENDYKLFCVTAYDDHNNAYGYLLKNDSWQKMVDSTNSLKQKMLSTWLNENLFFLKQAMKESISSCLWSYSIIRFDTKNERFTEIQIPCIESETAGTCFLTVQRGKLHFYVKYSIGLHPCIKVWSLDEDRVNWSCVEMYTPKLVPEVS
ncbi:F-box protein At3g08750-like [Rutidosis leptorrhynchoides]|uniref:F-box protein At3g08750-like n=1 Tax=Rutidosis leptorrhynchoides TaxID=125765 RepID=UPI003A99FC04